MDMLAALPEDELRNAVLSHLSPADKRSVALVCSAWRAAVAALPTPRLHLTKEQVATDAFLEWLCRAGRAAQVKEFSVAPTEGCVGEVCMNIAYVRRLLSHVTHYSDPISQQVDRVVAELPCCVEHLNIGTPASVAAARLQLDRLTTLRSLVLGAGFYQELTGLPGCLTSLRLNRNVVYVRLLGDLSGLQTLELPIYDQAQLAAVASLPRLIKVRLHLYAGVGLSLAAMPRMAPTLQHLELRTHGAAVHEAAALAALTRLTALAVDVDLSFFGPSARDQETLLLASMQLPPSLTRLRVARSCTEPIPAALLARIAMLRPRLRQLFLSPRPEGWLHVGNDEPWEPE